MSPLLACGALAGHVALCVEAVNRLHGLGLQRRIVDALTAVCGLMLVGAPAWGAVELARGGPPSPLLRGYACGAIAALALIAAWRACLRWDSARDRLSRIESIDVIDLGGRLGREAAPGRVVHFLSRLPGNELLRLAVERRTIVAPRLPATLDGLKIVHLTDLHMSGRLGLAYFQELVRLANRERPDLVCLTGDVVESPACLAWVSPALAGLEARLGAYFIVGNHDEKAGADAVRRALVEAGLVDVSAANTAPAQGLRVAGDERPWFPSPDAAPADAFTVLLAHTPDRIESAARLGVDLVLAGHNHGGQVCPPLVGPILCPSRHSVRYASGTFRRGQTVMHVSRGAGSLFPVRIGCPPELAVLTLRRA